MRLACGLLGGLWALSPLIDATHPLLIGVQATAGLGVLLLVLAALPGWRTRVAAAVITVAAVFTAPLLSWSGADPDLRVATINTQVAGAESAALQAELSELSPDVVVLVETTPAEATAVAQLLGLTVTGEIAPGLRGVAVLAATDSRAEQHRDELHQMPVVEFDDLTVAGVHTAAPVNDRLAELWTEELAEVSAVLDQPGPVIAAGDFNATVLHPRFRNLPATDCTLPVPTWPMPVSGLHLDHVLLSGARCTGAGTFAVPGTDHRGVWADVAVG